MKLPFLDEDAKPFTWIEVLSESIDKATTATAEDRAYIGGSNAGHECDALLALSLRGFPSDVVQGRTNRIFRDGHRIEEIVVADLKAAGLHVEEVDPSTGKQWRVIRYGGHFRAHADGRVLPEDGKYRLLEIKSMNKQSFAHVKKHGLKTSKPTYYVQMQLQMSANNMGGLFVAYCKDNAEYYLEEIQIDPEEVTAKRQRIERILQDGTGQRVANSSLDYRCKMCFKSTACWSQKLPTGVIACNHCKQARPVFKSSAEDRQWVCLKFGKVVPLNNPACSEFEVYEP